MSHQHHPDTAPAGLDVHDPDVTQYDLVREGARRDGVEIVHYAPRFPVPGTKEEKRVERTIALCLLIAGVCSLAFVVTYVAWNWEYVNGGTDYALFTPLLGTFLGVALLGVGAAVIIWAKKLLPDEISVQDRHDNPDLAERKLTGATVLNMVDETGIKRRPLLKVALAAGLLPVAGAPLVLLGGMVEDPHPDGEEPLFDTGWGKDVRLVREDGSPIRPADVSEGGLETVFPGIPAGNTNRYADSPTLLVHLRPEDGARARARLAERDLFPAEASEEDKDILRNAHYNNFFAYSKICTHAGCPASLYEQQTQRLLCPCHQSQFDVIDACRPVFGPATRPLPQLPITVDDEGFFIAKSDYLEAVGPAFWERP
jgi:ubiquinol-cytochrome c reductase iron-sulfur subunit